MRATTPESRAPSDDLSADIERVTKRAPKLWAPKPLWAATSSSLARWAKAGSSTDWCAKRKSSAAKSPGKWESFLIQVVPNPMPGVDERLVIAGSDKRGTIYGIYELSEQIGVSPWYWWADVPVETQSAAFRQSGPLSCRASRR